MKNILNKVKEYSINLGKIILGLSTLIALVIGVKYLVLLIIWI